MEKTYLRLSINVNKGLQTNQNISLESIEEEGRVLYSSLIEKLENQIENGVIKQESFQNLVEEIKQNIFRKMNLNSGYQPSEREITFTDTYDGKIKKASGPVISIGKLKNNTISVADDTVSRVHALILVFENHLVVIDNWSLNGTLCTNRENKNKVCEGSFCQKRNIMVFGQKEAFKLKMGLNLFSVSFFPKTCIVCFDQARQIRHNCGHGVICRDCYDKLNKNIEEVTCPICRYKGKGKESHCYNSYSVSGKS
jgi:hypothetical protein